MGFKNVTKYILFQSGTWYTEIFHPVHCCMAFMVPSKVNWTQISAFSLVYSFESDRLDTMMLFHSVLCMCETGSCTLTWKVQKAGAAWTQLVLYLPFVSACHQTCSPVVYVLCWQFVRERGYYIAGRCHRTVLSFALYPYSDDDANFFADINVYHPVALRWLCRSVVCCCAGCHVLMSVSVTGAMLLKIEHVSNQAYPYCGHITVDIRFCGVARRGVLLYLEVERDNWLSGW